MTEKYHPPILPIKGGKVPSPLVGEGKGGGEFWMSDYKSLKQTIFKEDVK